MSAEKESVSQGLSSRCLLGISQWLLTVVFAQVRVCLNSVQIVMVAHSEENSGTNHQRASWQLQGHTLPFSRIPEREKLCQAGCCYRINNSGLPFTKGMDSEGTPSRQFNVVLDSDRNELCD